VLLHHIGGNYYFDKIWMEGRNYGFEFPLPDKVRALQRELAVTVPAKFESAQVTNSAAANPSVTQQLPGSLSTQSNERAEALPLPDRESEPAVAAREDVAALQQEQPENRAPVGVDSRQDSVQSNAQRSQNNAVAPAARPADEQLPATASNWFTYLLVGALLLGLGGLSFRARALE
jgi:LPXTG-motif cell wall-anchored protein